MNRREFDNKLFMAKHGVFGPPAILFFDKKGYIVNEATLQGEIDLEGFLRHIENKAIDGLLVKN